MVLALLVRRVVPNEFALPYVKPHCPKYVLSEVLHVFGLRFQGASHGSRLPSINGSVSGVAWRWLKEVFGCFSCTVPSGRVL